jgi:fructose-bisphosphate aldolase, class II
VKVLLAQLSEVLEGTIEGKYAIPAFNVYGYEDAKPIVEAAEELQVPVILATNIVALEYMPMSTLSKILIDMAEKSSVPVVVHLDHGKDYNTIVQALYCGYSSVMYDGSQLPLEQNIKNTKEIVKLAKSLGISVEGEIGSVGYSDPNLGIKGFFTDPNETRIFFEETGVDAVAVSVGTVHRMEKQTANIDFNLIEEIEKVIPVPLVMHGSTGIPNRDLQKIAKTKFGKVNIGTAIRQAFGYKLRDEMNKNPEIYDRLELFKEPMKTIKNVALEKMKLLNLENYHSIKVNEEVYK